MAILSRRNQAGRQSGVNDWHTVWFQFMEDLITQGWRVLGTGDGVTYENSGQKVVGAAFGRLVTPGPGSLLDGETFTIDDGSTSITFEFDTVPDGVGGGNVAVDISAATDEFDVRDAIITAVNGQSWNITAAAGFRAGVSGAGGDPTNTAVVLLTNDVTGAGGNTSSGETVVNADFSLTDMTGGGVAAGGSGGQFHLFTASASAIDGTGPWVAGNWGNQNPFPTTLGACWIRMATPSDAAHYVELLFQMGFDSNPTLSDGAMSVIMCRDTQRFSVGATEWQRPGVDSGVALKLGVVAPLVDDPEIHPRAFFGPGTGGYAHWFIGDSDVDYDFMFYTGRDGPSFFGEVFANFGRFRVVGAPSRSDNSVDPDPYVWLANFESGDGNTNHNFFNGDHITPENTTTQPERLEDRTSVGGQIPVTFATFALGDPAVIASKQGHYAVALLPPFIDGFSNDIFRDEWNSTDPATGRNIVDTVVNVGRANSQTTLPTRFFKGVLKNDLLGWSSTARNFPVVERPVDAADPFRVSWGRFHLYWGAEERVNI